MSEVATTIPVVFTCPTALAISFIFRSAQIYSSCRSVCSDTLTGRFRVRCYFEGSEGARRCPLYTCFISVTLLWSLPIHQPGTEICYNANSELAALTSEQVPLRFFAFLFSFFFLSKISMNNSPPPEFSDASNQFLQLCFELTDVEIRFSEMQTAR